MDIGVIEETNVKSILIECIPRSWKGLIMMLNNNGLVLGASEDIQLAPDFI
tara:strand:- start:423 stop:575 length:153 start_codon:yes stop_codon:yes gene_type:complete